MKPLGDPIRNDWKRDFYQFVDFDYNLWRKVKRDTEDSISIHNLIGNEIYDQLTDQIMDHIVTFSSFFSLWRHTVFDHEFYNRDVLSSSFFQDW